jgi:hypothetical protein
MSNNANANIGCTHLGEYVDENELPPNHAFSQGEIVRPTVVADYVDIWAKDDGLKEFTVLLRDGRVAAVRGQGLKYLAPTIQGESGSYGVIVRSRGEEVLVGLFKIIEIVGIFHGEVRLDQKIA